MGLWQCGHSKILRRELEITMVYIRVGVGVGMISRKTSNDVMCWAGWCERPSMLPRPHLLMRAYAMWFRCQYILDNSQVRVLQLLVAWPCVR
jgi:hypothetical protein